MEISNLGYGNKKTISSTTTPGTTIPPRTTTPYTEKMSPVYICQNDKPMTSLALSTAHQVKTNLCQPHSLKSCHIFVINLPKTCRPQFLFHAVDGRRVPI